MIKKTIFTLAFLILIISQSYAGIMRDVSESACRVIAGNGAGSGTAVYQDKNNIYVLTNAHVVGRHLKVTVEFWKYGKKVPKPISGSVIWRKQDFQQGYDFAIVSVNKSKFNSLPKITHFIPQNTANIKSGTYILTAGCPRSQWLSVKEGSIVRKRGHEILFRPAAENGQSGSGLFINLNGRTYIIGVITARDRRSIIRDENGFDITLGIALDINQLRQALTGNKSSTTIVKTAVAPRFLTSKTQSIAKLYAKSTDGRYWLQNDDGSVNVPPGIQISEWNCPDPSDQFAATTQPRRRLQPQPPGDMRPLPGPVLPQPKSPEEQQNNGGYGSIPPGFGESQDPDLEKQIEELRNKYQKLQEEYNKCEGKLKAKYEEGYSVGLKETKEDLDKLEKKLTEKDKLIADLQQQIDDKDSQLKDTNEAVNNLEIQLNQLQQEITTLDTKLEEKNVTIQQLQQPEEKPVEKSDGPSVFSKIGNYAKGLSPVWWALLGLGGGVLFGKRKALAAVPSLVKKVFSGSSKNNYTNVAPDEAGNLKTVLDKYFSDTKAQIDAVADYTSSRFNDLDSKINRNTNTNDNENNNTNTGGDTDTTDNVDNKDSNSNTVNNNFNFGEGLDIESLKKCNPNNTSFNRIKQFFELKKHDGESIEQWAFFALLYKEAMQLLRRGRISITVTGDKVTLQGQRLAAERIDQWVQDQYIQRMSIEKLSLDTIYHEAMLGFLYKEAVQLLKNGTFPILGAKETADAVENWVKREFLNRMGVSL